MKQTRAFSLIELVFIIALFGIVMLSIPNTLHIAQKSCYINIANTLNAMQEEISFLYASYALRQSAPSSSEVLSIINAHKIDSKTCKFGFSNKRLRAEVSGIGVNFTLEPSDFSIQPAFTCPFSSNQVCKEILLRTKRL